MSRPKKENMLKAILLSSLLALSEASFARNLEENAADENVVYDDYYEYDLSQFSVRFDKCQYVKMFDDQLAEDEDNDSPLALKHFVLFRLCPADFCSSCDVEGVVYGKYVVPVDTYLQQTIENEMQAMEQNCADCVEECSDDAEDCNLCSQDCISYNNLEANGFIDASQFTQCQALESNGDDDYYSVGDDGSGQLYIGPRCNDYGKISIGLFNDENCWEPNNVWDIERILGGTLSYHFLRQSSSNEGICLSCKENENDRNDADEYDKDEVNEMCEDLYDASAKCESETGLQVGFVQSNRDDGDYENQVENEFLACTFINSLIWNSYTETGEINVGAVQDEIVRVVTKKQTVSLSFLSVLILSMVAGLYYLDRRIKQMEESHPMMVFTGDPSFS